MDQAKNRRLAACEELDIVKTFECGQCFRWNADADDVYRGVVRGYPARVWTENGGKSTADGMIYNLYDHFTSKSVPVIIGEFGAANKDNEADRAEWAGYLVENAKKYVDYASVL